MRIHVIMTQIFKFGVDTMLPSARKLQLNFTLFEWQFPLTPSIQN